jgi:hypothetical protein
VIVRETLRQETRKHKEINRIIKEEQAHEFKRNLTVFTNLNNQERLLRKELVKKQQALADKENRLKIANVVNEQKKRVLK